MIKSSATMEYSFPRQVDIFIAAAALLLLLLLLLLLFPAAAAAPSY